MGSTHEGGGGTCPGSIAGALALCRDRVGHAPPLVLANGERRHSSIIILWGAMLGVDFVFELVHCTIGWSIGSC